jgi:hypothetical protein
VRTMLRTPLSRLRRLMLPLLMLTLTGCGHGIAGIEGACAVFERPDWSSKDTEQTQRWMERYAVRWERLCLKE